MILKKSFNLWLFLFCMFSLKMAHSEDLATYVNNCKNALGISSAAGSIPGFSCANGIYIPTFLERPGLETNSNFVGKVSIPSNPNVDAVFLCRGYNFSTGNTNLNGFILHNRNNGNTCYFDAIGGSSGNQLPALDSSAASTRWRQPINMDGRCTGCHTADPYIVTPSMANAFIQLNLGYPTRPLLGSYNVVNSSVSGSVFSGWQNDVSGWLQSNSCASACHKLVNPSLAPSSIGSGSLSAQPKGFHSEQQSAMLTYMSPSLSTAYTFNFNSDTPSNGKLFMEDQNLGQAYVLKTNNAWAKLSDNTYADAVGKIVGGNGKFYGQRIGAVGAYVFTGAACFEGACPGWQQISNFANPVTFESNGTNLVQGLMTGSLYRYTGTPCSQGGTTCNGWQMIDQNSWFIHPVVVTSGNIYYQRPSDFRLYRYTGTPCSGSTCSGWQAIDAPPSSDMRGMMAGDNGTLYAIRGNNNINNGVWRFTGQVCSGSTCNGWQRLDNRANTFSISAGGGKLYQMLNDGSIWRYTGTPCASSTSCVGWVKVRNADANIEQIKVSASGTLYAHNGISKALYKFNGTSNCSGSSCPGWTTVSAAGEISHFYVDTK